MIYARAEDKLIAVNTFAHNGKNNDGNPTDNNKFKFNAVVNYFKLQVQQCCAME